MTGLTVAPIAVLHGGRGSGKTTVLEHLHASMGGRTVSAADIIEAIESKHPLAMEDALYRLIEAWLDSTETLFIDDFGVVEQVLLGCSSAYPRSGLFEVALTGLAEAVVSGGKRLIISTAPRHSSALGRHAFYYDLPNLEPEDYRLIAEGVLGRDGVDVDFVKVHRFAPKLDGRLLAGTFRWLSLDGEVSTDRVITYLKEHDMVSNVDLGEVQSVDLSALKGLDDTIESLEANIVVPFEHDELSVEFGVKPKRGVLLAGPPGTGKTTIGRALAHRLRGKFFLLDGPVVSGTSDFFEHMHKLFQAAAQNAPSVIFIDDADVMFKSGGSIGLYRYLLTMLDGLESESQGGVCVMMTAMNVGDLPPAMVRSGRIELWLETRLPDSAARQAILTDLIDVPPVVLADADLAPVVEATEGLTGADLKGVIEDAKTRMAYDRAKSRPPATATEYLVRATETIRANQQRYAVATGDSTSDKDDE